MKFFVALLLLAGVFLRTHAAAPPAASGDGAPFYYGNATFIGWVKD